MITGKVAITGRSGSGVAIGVARLSRRAVLTGAVAAAALTGCRAPWQPANTHLAAARDLGPAWQAGPVMHIVAHPDDDFCFMNPGIAQAVRSTATNAITVVVTSAEGDGRNIDTATPGRERVPPDYRAYAAARQHGMRRAYARMAGLAVDSGWRQDAVPTASGLVVDWYVLVADPRVQLYFLNLAHDAGPEGTPVTTLLPLWDARRDDCPTLATGRPQRPDQRVSRQAVIDCLADLLQRHRPTTVRTMDPDPERDWGKPGSGSADHPDHTATAEFALAALAAHTAAVGGGALPIVEHYRAYANRFWPDNLSLEARAEKQGHLLVYMGADGSPCPTRDCGDYQLGTDPGRSTHVRSTVERYNPTSSWLARQADGTLIAVTALGGRVVVWSEHDSGSWTGPTVLEGSWIMSAPALAVGPDGRTHVVGLRRAPGPGGTVTVNLVHAVRVGSGPFSTWRSLGSPDAAAAEQARRQGRETGVPAATVDGDGRLWVWARSFSGGLSSRRESRPGGPWEPWQSLGDGLVQDSPTAVTTADGLVQVFAPNKTGVQRQRQLQRGGALVADALPGSTAVASGGLLAVESAQDRVCLYYRRATSENVLAYRETAGGLGWPGQPADLGGHGGTGPIAVAARADAGAAEVILAQRNSDGGISVSQPHGGGGWPTWSDLPGLIAGAPALATDRQGRRVLAVLGLDGRMHVARWSDPSPGSSVGKWSTV